MHISNQPVFATPEVKQHPAPRQEHPVAAQADSTPALQTQTETLHVTPLAGSGTAPQVPLATETATAVKPTALSPAEKPRPPARPARASAYGPGLYGNRTANGTRLTPDTVGVAHKTLPLGTRLEVIVNGRAVPARVIDRGPYERGRDFDLTTGLIKKLGFPNCNLFGVRQILIRIFK
jgi:rare lipoprotein A (peptidoglycan hydrolase)